MSAHRGKLRFLLFGAWLLLAFAGLAGLARYGAIPGPSLAAAPEWPSDSGIPETAGRNHLVMFVHPWCPCSEASLAELEALLRRNEDRTAVDLVFLRPAGLTKDRVQSALWNHARQIAGVRVIDDVDGRQAKRFGAATSGDTFVFDPDGKLVFHGGITAARGHIGPSRGSAAVDNFLQTGSPGVTSTPAFGCPLFSSPPETAPKS